MKRKRIAVVAGKGFKKINNIFNEIIGRFDVESIHDFRTEMKKLRAFLRLLNFETGDDTLKISKNIKTFYGYAGTIRNLQLQLKAMTDYPAGAQYAAIDNYVDYLKKIIGKWEENIMEFAAKKNDLSTGKKKLIKKLPHKLSKSAAKIFLQNKMGELACLLKELPDDEALHSIRKLFKDISYTWSFVKRYNKLLPHDLSDKEKVKSFTALIGLFLDKRIGIILLETYYKDCEEGGLFFGNETRELQDIENRWMREKEELAQVIYMKTGLLEVMPVHRGH